MLQKSNVWGVYDKTGFHCCIPSLNPTSATFAEREIKTALSRVTVAKHYRTSLEARSDLSGYLAGYQVYPLEDTFVYALFVDPSANELILRRNGSTRRCSPTKTFCISFALVLKCMSRNRCHIATLFQVIIYSMTKYLHAVCSSSQNAVCKRNGVTGLFSTEDCKDI